MISSALTMKMRAACTHTLQVCRISSVYWLWAPELWWRHWSVWILSLFSEIELLSRLHHSLCLSKDHIGRISCCLADFWAAASPTLTAIICLITCTMCVSVCVYTPLLRCIYELYIWSLSPLRCMCVSDLFPALAAPSWWWPGSPLHVNLLHARCWLAARPPHLASVSSPHFLSLPAHRKASLMSGWLSKGLFIAAHCRSLFATASFFFSQFETEVLRPDCNWFLACKTAQLIEIALFYSRRRF